MKIIQQSAVLVGLMVPVDYNDFDGSYDANLQGMNPERLIEQAGRTCYKSEDRITPDSSKAFIDKLTKLQHLSVLEHSCASIRIITDRGISHEIVRHRIASYSQESTRYVNYTNEKHGAGDIQFILPEGLTPVQEHMFLQKYEADQKFYNAVIEAGCTPQQARDGLPNGLKTELVMTCNFREWMHFLTLRTAPAAHPKMRTLAKKVEKLLQKVAPNVFKESA